MRVPVGNRQEMLAALEGFELDVTVMGRPPAGFPVERAVIGHHPHVNIAPPGPPLARRRRVPLEEVVREVFLLREPGSGTRVEIGSNQTIKQAVMVGMGVALLSAHTIAAEVADGRLAVLDVEGLPVVRRSEKRLLPAAQAL